MFLPSQVGSLSPRWQPSLFPFPHAMVWEGVVERASLFLHLLESGLVILTFSTNRMCRSDMLGLLRLDCERSHSFHLGLMEHSLWGKPATYKKSDLPEITMLWVCPSWPGEEAAWRETAVAATPAQAPDMKRRSDTGHSSSRRCHTEDQGPRQMAPVKPSQHLQSSELPSGGPRYCGAEEQNCRALPKFLTLRIVNMIKWMSFYSTKFWGGLLSKQQ